ncbi:hypothetical protein B0J11DRAFT_512856 [Dendryphion nanum]|uniref:Transmembrane protein n=1 Tax=Dendryphion nanum TaxID=256645 RepID=A0A9P9CYJ6_9PLEO|nr:hypothetical protein B0J11DRAFT_512856 [Dendryphion nanum]
MSEDASKNGVAYGILSSDPPENTSTNPCQWRSDDRGAWNIFKTLWLFVFHMAGCGLLVFTLLRTDGKDFNVGSTWIFRGSLLYQTQVTALLSVALVFIRFIVTSCTALLIWRAVYILLEKTGITLDEILFLTSYRILPLPWKRLRTHVLWSLWAITTILLTWPAGFAAPLATSSVSWIPEHRLQDSTSAIQIPTIGAQADWTSLLYDDTIAKVVAFAVAMSVQDPAYAFKTNQVPLRRYFDVPRITLIPDGSRVDLAVPYLSTNITWISVDDKKIFQNVNNPDFQDVSGDRGFSTRVDGMVSIVRDTQWKAQNAKPLEATRFFGHRLVAVKTATLEKGHKLPSGETIDENTPCPTESNYFGTLPKVNQYRSKINFGNSFAATDCFIVANTTITSGRYNAKNCSVISSVGSPDRHATCTLTGPVDKSSIDADWLASLALDFTSETLKYNILQNRTLPQMSGTLNEHTAAMLQLGYHAAWGGLMKALTISTENGTLRLNEPVVRAEIDRLRLYTWLGVNATLFLSAIFVTIASSNSKVKTIRNTTLAILTMNLSEVLTDPRAIGLCNAVKLSKKDRKLPKLRWKHVREENDIAMTSGCSHSKVVFDET